MSEELGQNELRSILAGAPGVLHDPRQQAGQVKVRDFDSRKGSLVVGLLWLQQLAEELGDLPEADVQYGFVVVDTL
ncbi:hypothetical protein [Streptomyces rishiriensis]|uniref:hypothetical protein n=1 Tax=Streptomyces rishiriensis TaxID=68264 RepID=UPI0027D883C4|nr:hypothetical protein [Streptomyces rishiriensis]